MTTLAASKYDRTRVILAGISALILTVGVARFAYTPMLPIMRGHAGLSDLAGGWLATLNYVGYICGALIASSTNSLGLKFKLYRLGLVVAVLSTIGMGLTDNVALWAGLRFVSGFSSTAGLLLASGLVLNWLMRNGYKPELGLHFMGVGLGIIVSGMCMAGMAGRVSWELQWVVLGLLGAMFLVPAWLWMPAPHTVGEQHVTPRAHVPSPRWMNLLIAAYFCAGFGYVISATFLVAIVERLPLLKVGGVWVWISVGLAAIPSCFVWDRIANSMGQVRALILAFFLQMTSIGIPAVSSTTFATIASSMLYGGTFVGIVSLTLSVVGRHFPANPAKAMARLTISYGIAQIAAPAMAGYIATSKGGYEGALIVAVLVMGLGTLTLIALRREDASLAIESTAGQTV